MENVIPIVVDGVLKSSCEYMDNKDYSDMIFSITKTKNFKYIIVPNKVILVSIEKEN